MFTFIKNDLEQMVSNLANVKPMLAYEIILRMPWTTYAGLGKVFQ
jgi:hypothetical protein